jgi:hypothetical protein
MHLIAGAFLLCLTQLVFKKNYRIDKTTMF